MIGILRRLHRGRFLAVVRVSRRGRVSEGGTRNSFGALCRRPVSCRFVHTTVVLYALLLEFWVGLECWVGLGWVRVEGWAYDGRSLSHDNDRSLAHICTWYLLSLGTVDAFLQVLSLSYIVVPSLPLLPSNIPVLQTTTCFPNVRHLNCRRTKLAL